MRSFSSSHMRSFISSTLPRYQTRVVSQGKSCASVSIIRMSTMERNIELEESIRNAKFYLEEAHSACVTSNYPVDSVAWAGKTTYCSELVIASNEEYGKMLITDKELQSTQVDESIYHEHLVHPAILAYRSIYGNKPLKVLVLGAGEGATIREIVKYPRDSIEEIVWNDIDADLVQLCDEHLGYVDPTSPLYDQVYNDPTRCKRLYLDAAALLESPPDVPYDIIISDLPDPVTSDGLPDSSLYSSKFWKNIYSCAAEKCVVSTHTGPMCQFSVGMATSIGLAGDLVAAGFMKPLVGKVAISSFMGEWGYLICTKDTEIVSSVPRVKNSDGDRVSSSSTHSVQMSPQVWASHLPEGVVVLDEFALQSFFLIPNYYYKR